MSANSVHSHILLEYSTLKEQEMRILLSGSNHYSAITAAKKNAPSMAGNGLSSSAGFAAI